MKNESASPVLLSPDDLPFAKKLIALAAGGTLSYLSTRHVQSWDHAFALGHAEGFASGQVKGYETGKTNGKKEGYAEGYAAGRQLLEIRDLRDRENAFPGVDVFLFEDWKLPITPAIEEKMRADVRDLLPQHKHPTADQWKMILSGTPSTYVIAGAGSGKSTTLILRLLLLRHYLKFEWGSMTVVTFTKMSQLDFIKKLLEMAKLWKVELSQETAETVVNTFHSKILKFVRALSDEKIAAFEFFDGAGQESKATVAHNPFETRLNESQRGLLNACYTELYFGNERFRTLIGDLYHDSLTLEKTNVDKEKAARRLKAIKSISEQDKEVMDLTENAWTQAGKWPISGVFPKRETIYLRKLPFQVHGRIEGKEEIAVVLLPDSIPGRQEARPDSQYSLASEMSGKKLIFDAYSDQKIVWIDDAADMESYVKWLANQATIAPTFDFQVNGDLSSSPLLDCFVNAAAFIENLGLNVTDAVSKMAFQRNDPDGRFFEALGMFWPAFMDYLAKQTPRVMTFNRMFAMFGEGCGETLRQVPDAVLRSMSHLMIDEFQDVSPQIVSWLRGVLREIRRRGPELSEGRSARCSSLLCVGDDWQSIYGWRGSSPKYFIDFESEFKSPATMQVMLRHNFRSHQYIIDAAEHVVKDVHTIPGKKAESGVPKEIARVPVKVLDGDDAKLDLLVSKHYDDGESVMVLYREGGSAERDRLKKLLGRTYQADRKLEERKRRLKILTIHKSKGLEADAVFMLGDCKFKKSSPYKNKIYQIANLGTPGEPHPYDESQKDELLRLAYVGITRAGHYCYWLLPAEKSPSAKPKASDKLPNDAPYFHNLRQVK